MTWCPRSYRDIPKDSAWYFDGRGTDEQGVVHLRWVRRFPPSSDHPYGFELYTIPLTAFWPEGQEYV